MADATKTVVKTGGSFEPLVKKALDAQPQRRVRVKLPMGADPAKTKELPVGINGHFYHIQYGVYTTVPDEVYRLLLRGGHIDPLDEEDQFEVPKPDEQYAKRAEDVKELN